MSQAIRSPSSQARYALRLATVLALLAGVHGSAPGHVALAKDPDPPEEVDYVSLAARLISDGHFDRARAALAEVNTAKEGVDLQRYHTLSGLVGLEQKAFEAARRAFENAIEAQIDADTAEAEEARDADEDADEGAAKPKQARPVRADPVLLLYLAQASYGMKDYAGTVAVLDRAGKDLDDETSVHLMRAQSYWELKKPDDAIAALRRGAKAFPDDAQFVRMQVFYLIELGLYQEVMRLGESYLARTGATADDHVAMGESLRQGKQLHEAGLILESARLRFPLDEQVMLALAHVYLDRERPLSAAMLLEDASRLNPKYTVEAAELYKQAGRPERALSLNARVGDQKEKLKQRLAILLAMERFELVAAMAPSLSRTGLLADDEVRYALAYGYYKIGDFASAEQQLKHITQSELFNNANQLRKAMETCRASGWECI